MAALFLTVFAIQWIAIERLPRLPFSTILDTVAQCAIGGLMMMLVGDCVEINQWAARHRRVDRALIGFPAGRRMCLVQICRAVQWEMRAGRLPGVQNGAGASC